MWLRSEHRFSKQTRSGAAVVDNNRLPLYLDKNINAPIPIPNKEEEGDVGWRERSI
jgi:hypothetical protein